MTPRRQGRSGCLAAGALATALLTGCSDGNASIRGTVKLDGRPVTKGVIQFVPADANSLGAAVAILDGAYEIPAEKGTRAGTYRVVVRWPELTGRKIPNPLPEGDEKMIQETRELVPEKFNKQSTLAAELRPGTNTLDFDLSSK